VDDYRRYGKRQERKERLQVLFLMLFILAALSLVGGIEYQDQLRLAKSRLSPVDRDEVRYLTKRVNPAIYEASSAELRAMR